MNSEIGARIPSKYSVLYDVVKDYPGILSAAGALLRELGTPAQNWPVLVRELRSYALRNFYLHDHHPRGLEAVSAIIDLFMKALDTETLPVRQAAVEGLIFYLEKILVDGNSGLIKYGPVLKDCFQSLNRLTEDQFFLIVTNPHQLKKLGQIILGRAAEGIDTSIFSEILPQYLSRGFLYWLKEADPAEWLRRDENALLEEDHLRKLEELFHPISHAYIKKLIRSVEAIPSHGDSYERLKQLVQLPGYMQFVRYYEDLAGMLAVTDDKTFDTDLKLRYLVRIMHIHGLYPIYENTLREMNRTLCSVAKGGNSERIRKSIDLVLPVFKSSFTEFPETVLYCLQSIGNEIYKTEDLLLIEWFLHHIVSLGFQYPDIRGVNEEWQVQSNRGHLKNIRVWLELIENNPLWSKSLISALIIHLKLCGIHISDTDIFQKDITRLLNSDIKSVFHPVKLLAKTFPVYFSDIGAEGPLREVSTEIDESTHRADVLVHFLRKQSHVESSARVVDFFEEAIRFWSTGDKAPLLQYLPEEIYSRIDISGPYVDSLHKVFLELFRRKGISEVTDLLRLTDEETLAFIASVPDIPEREQRRAYLALKFYQLLNKKYRLDPADISEHLIYARSLGLPNTQSLIEVLERGSVPQKLEKLLDYLDLLKEIVLSPRSYEPVENIFRKRHVAAGIPSMYGKYHERKFDALSLTLRLENLANVLFEELLNEINLRFVTRAALFKIQKYVNLFFRALKLDGISSGKMENALELLSVAIDVRRFSFSQYIDIFRGFSDAVQDILNTHYSDIFKNDIKQIISQLGPARILPKYLHVEKWHSDSEFADKITEQFLREIVAGSFGLQQLDTFISRILKTLFEQAEGLDVGNLDLLMSYDPKKALSGIHNPNDSTEDRIHLGNKGYNLIKLASLGISVPPGFIITTEVFRCENAINSFRYVKQHLDEGIKVQLGLLEKQTGKVFGNSANPLLVSVRSGGAISMPGMMISFLNVGINEKIVEGLIQKTGKPWFAWDCYRRFLQGWGMSYGMERDSFDDIMNFFKDRYGVAKKIQFSPEQMREVALGYRETIRNQGIAIADDPAVQLQVAIEQVFRSWHSKKAQAYREILGISENWGTAVIVQMMVYGNLDDNSGTGVFFTRSPQETEDRVLLWGDFAASSQGEDIVSGLVKARPISNEQKPFEDRLSESSLEDTFPELYRKLLGVSNELVRKEQWGAQEIEFTFENTGKETLYILQTRDMALRRKERLTVFAPSKKLSASYLSRGIGVGGGALSGKVVFDLDDMQKLRKEDPSIPLILIRADTVPDDIRHISAADGLLTARGGSTSHASIIANRLGKTCVVGCNSLMVWEQDKKCRIHERIIKAGEFLSIDGRNGSIYSGRHRLQEIKAEVVGKL